MINGTKARNRREVKVFLTAGEMRVLNMLNTMLGASGSKLLGLGLLSLLHEALTTTDVPLGEKTYKDVARQLEQKRLDMESEIVALESEIAALESSEGEIDG